jgi:hypothetical protein
MNEMEVNDVPLLEWLDDDSEAGQFILVQSRKKQLENSAGVVNVRSKRTTPSIYRDRGGGKKIQPSTKNRGRKK